MGGGKGSIQCPRKGLGAEGAEAAQSGERFLFFLVWLRRWFSGLCLPEALTFSKTHAQNNKHFVSKGPGFLMTEEEPQSSSRGALSCERRSSALEVDEVLGPGGASRLHPL